MLLLIFCYSFGEYYGDCSVLSDLDDLNKSKCSVKIFDSSKGISFLSISPRLCIISFLYWCKRSNVSESNVLVSMLSRTSLRLILDSSNSCSNRSSSVDTLIEACLNASVSRLVRRMERL